MQRPPSIGGTNMGMMGVSFFFDQNKMFSINKFCTVKYFLDRNKATFIRWSELFYPKKN